MELTLPQSYNFENVSIKKGVTKLFHHPETVGICLIIVCVVSPVLIWSLGVNVTWCCFVRMRAIFLVDHNVVDYFASKLT